MLPQYVPDPSSFSLLSLTEYTSSLSGLPRLRNLEWNVENWIVLHVVEEITTTIAEICPDLQGVMWFRQLQAYSVSVERGGIEISLDVKMKKFDHLWQTRSSREASFNLGKNSPLM